MKRLAWLLLAVFCTALAQVQPVELPASGAASCPCCEIPGACDMPDCGLPPSAASAGFLVAQPAASVVSTARRRAARPGRTAMESALLLDARRAAAAALTATNEPVAPAAVPLFKAHHSFLI